MQRLSPMDIFNKDFRHAMRGYDIKEVDQFLDLILQSYESVLNENTHLKDQLRKARRKGGNLQSSQSHPTVDPNMDDTIQEILVRLERLEKVNFG